MNEKTKKKIMEMHKKGMTIYAIAKQLGLSQTGVKYVLDPKYREYMSQISHKRYSKAQSSQPNNAISSSDAAWLTQHRQSIEHRNRILKSISLSAVYLIMVASAFTLIAAIVANISYIYIAIDVVVFFAFAIMGLILIKDSQGENDLAVVAGITSGLFVAGAIALLYIAPIASISQYPISMQVFYPNHPNITITQNCTGFTTSESGYLNGQPINPQNTTECNLPQSMAQYEYNPFDCNISGKNITCTAALDENENVTWQGTILNVSKR